MIEPTLQAAEIRRSANLPTNDLTAYDLYLRALPHWGSLEKDRVFQALDLLGQAVERDPHYGSALALAAFCHQQLEVNGWVDDLEANRRAGIDLARRAIRFAPDDPEVAIAAFALGYFGEDIDVALGVIDRCLALNPSFARGWAWSAVLRNFAGQPNLAIEHYNTSLRLSPRDRIGVGPGVALGAAYFFRRQFDDAAASLLASLEQAPSFAVTYRLLASCYAHMGGSIKRGKSSPGCARSPLP